MAQTQCQVSACWYFCCSRNTAVILPSVSVEGFLWADNSVHPVIENEDVSLSLHTHTTQRHVTGAEGQADALGGPGGGGWKDTKVVSFHISASRAHKVSSETITQTSSKPFEFQRKEHIGIDTGLTHCITTLKHLLDSFRKTGCSALDHWGVLSGWPASNFTSDVSCESPLYCSSHSLSGENLPTSLSVLLLLNVHNLCHQRHEDH